MAPLACGEPPAAVGGDAIAPDTGGGGIDIQNPFQTADIGATSDGATGGTGDDVAASPDGTDDPSGGADAGRRPGACEFSANPGPGEAGAPCKANGDCDAGVCVDGPGGKICTRTCVDCCPGGMACEAAPGSDTVFVCVPKLKALCRPCGSDAFCAALAADALCVGYGVEGAFCGGLCVNDTDCPSGFGCKASKGEKGSAQQCVRLDGPCSCSDAAIAAGDSTPCLQQNEHGSCFGQRVCAATGLTACSATVAALETCNAKDDDCDGETDEGLTFDDCAIANDFGTCGGKTTCDGQKLGCSAATPAAESCNAVDDDCDGATDEALSGQACETKNAFGACLGLTTCDGKQAGCDAKTPAEELCNGKDDDCDGSTDEGFADTDLDLVADCLDDDDDADGSPDGADCAPLDLAIQPSATEACNGKDDNCDGQTDSQGAVGCSTHYQDVDGDGVGNAAASACLCEANATYPVKVAGDCNDLDKGANPAATEACNEKDDDCDDNVDELGAAGCKAFYQDLDKDGFGDNGFTACLCGPTEAVPAAKGGDCQDKDDAIHPAATEGCNLKDDDCDGTTDEADAYGCSAYYVDGDKDGVGKPGTAACLCGPSATHPTKEVGDCDDESAAISTKATEACNGKDDDCDNLVDEAEALGCSQLWADADEDGYGKTGDTACLCKPKTPYTASKGGDCNDSSAAVAPGIAESCNSKDDDCDGNTDPPLSTGCDAYFVDNDKDGFGDSFAQTKCLCVPTAPHTALKGGDCNDGDGGISLAGKEACNAKDDDCNGITDEPGALDCAPHYIDADKDGYGVQSASQCLCKPLPPFSALAAGDCNDAVPTIAPGQKEACNDIDDDCDSSTDEETSKPTFYLDQDNDSFGLPGSGKVLCAASGAQKATQAGDCDDLVASIYPTAKEICNSKDDDCNGATDDNASGVTTWYFDGDADGFGVSANAVQACGASGKYSTTKPGDCADGDNAVYPGHPEVTCNQKDDDCSAGDYCPVAHPCNSACNGKPTAYSCWCDSLCKQLGDCCNAAGGQGYSCVGSTCAICK